MHVQVRPLPIGEFGIGTGRVVADMGQPIEGYGCDAGACGGGCDGGSDRAGGCGCDTGVLDADFIRSFSPAAAARGEWDAPKDGQFGTERDAPPTGTQGDHMSRTSSPVMLSFNPKLRVFQTQNAIGGAELFSRVDVASAGVTRSDERNHSPPFGVSVGGLDFGLQGQDNFPANSGPQIGGLTAPQHGFDVGGDNSEDDDHGFGGLIGANAMTLPPPPEPCPGEFIHAEPTLSAFCDNNAGEYVPPPRDSWPCEFCDYLDNLAECDCVSSGTQSGMLSQVEIDWFRIVGAVDFDAYYLPNQPPFELTRCEEDLLIYAWQICWNNMDAMEYATCVIFGEQSRQDLSAFLLAHLASTIQFFGAGTFDGNIMGARAGEFRIEVFADEPFFKDLAKLFIDGDASGSSEDESRLCAGLIGASMIFHELLHIAGLEGGVDNPGTCDAGYLAQSLFTDILRTRYFHLISSVQGCMTGFVRGPRIADDAAYLVPDDWDHQDPAANPSCPVHFVR